MVESIGLGEEEEEQEVEVEAAMGIDMFAEVVIFERSFCCSLTSVLKWPESRRRIRFEAVLHDMHNISIIVSL